MSVLVYSLSRTRKKYDWGFHLVFSGRGEFFKDTPQNTKKKHSPRLRVMHFCNSRAAGQEDDFRP